MFTPLLLIRQVDGLLYHEVYPLNRRPFKYIKAPFNITFTILVKGIIDAFITSKGIHCTLLHFSFFSLV